MIYVVVTVAWSLTIGLLIRSISSSSQRKEKLRRNKLDEKAADKANRASERVVFDDDYRDSVRDEYRR